MAKRRKSKADERRARILMLEAEASRVRSAGFRDRCAGIGIVLTALGVPVVVHELGPVMRLFGLGP